jgi:uncharacterized protein (DUF58 family)
VGFAALNTGNNLLYLVLSLMLAFLALSGFLSELALRHVTVERRLPQEVFAGLENRVEILIRNTGSRSSSYALVIEDRLAPVPDPRRRRRRLRRVAGHCFVLRIQPGTCERRSYSWIPDVRGHVEFGTFVISTRFPFALFVKSMAIPAPGQVLVYPAVRSVPTLDRGGRHGPRGETETGSGGEGAELSGLRKFVAGDPARRIHWRSSVRRGELQIGEVEPEHDAEIEVMLRTRLGPPGETQESRRIARERFEERVVWAASEIVSHLEAGRRVALRSDASHFAPGTGAAHRGRLLGFLATVQPEFGHRADPSAGSGAAT